MDIDLKYLDEMVSPPDENIGVDNLLGVVIGGGSVYAGMKMLPKNMPGHLADHAYNYLDGFYAKNARKKTLYAKELAKSIKRIGSTSINPREAISYANTGVSSLVEQSISSLNEDLKAIDRKYIAGDYGETLTFNKDGSVRKGKTTRSGIYTRKT